MPVVRYVRNWLRRSRRPAVDEARRGETVDASLPDSGEVTWIMAQTGWSEAVVRQMSPDLT